MQKPLIVGLDIGTTSAVSIHDLKKNLLYLKSRKNFSTSNIIKQIIIFGTPLIIATDKQNVPQKIRKIAASFNAKVFSPDHDLTVEEKEKVVNISMRDSHERDALASALFAFKFYSPQFNTIDMNLETLNLKEYSDKVKEMIVRKEAKNIAEAIERVKPKKKEVKEVPKELEKINFEERCIELERRIKEEKGRYEILKTYAEKLETRVKNLEIQKQEYLEEQMKRNEETRKKVVKEKEIKTRDILINQLKFELSKEKSVRQAFDEKTKIEQEIKDIENEKMIPVIIIPEFTKESIININREFNISDKAVWVQNFKFSKVAAKVLASIKPKLVIGETDKETRDLLNESGIILVDTIKPEVRKCYAAISPEKIENEIKKIERKNFLKWLDDYKTRF
jgi:predicted RNase H-like nuclease (RuvC/YqgF family)